MINNKWTPAEEDDWWDKVLSADPHSYAEIKTEHMFTCFKLRFSLYRKRRRHIPEHVRSIMVKGLRDFCSLSSEGVYKGQYIDAFGFSCAIQDIVSAKMAYDLIDDKEHLKDTEIPAYFFTWFNKQSRLTSVEPDNGNTVAG